MFCLFALDRAHRYYGQQLCLLWLVLALMTSWSTYSIVHSAPVSSTSLNVSSSSTPSPPSFSVIFTNGTNENITNLLTPTTTPISLPISTAISVESYPNINITNAIVNKDNHDISVVVPKSLPDNELSTQDDFLDFNSDSGSFLLMCSVKSIRYWSPKCALHQTSELLSHRPSVNNLRNGFSGMSVRRSPNNATELIWFDVEKYEFHLARFAIHANATCDNSLTFNFNTTLDYSSNPRANDYHHSAFKERMVKIASSENHLMVSNYMLDRIDIYRFNDTKLKLDFVDSINAVRPSDIIFQHNQLYWIENSFRICKIKNFFNLKIRPLEPECHEIKNETIVAFTALENRDILYATQDHGHIYRLDWNAFDAQKIGHVDLPRIISMASMDSDIILLSEEDGQVHRLNVSSGSYDPEAVVIESTNLFDITIVGNNFDYQSEESLPEDASEDEQIDIIPVRNVYRKWLVLAFVLGSIVAFCWLILFIFRKPVVRQRFSTIQSKLPNARGILRNIRPYAQMRQTRATSISNALIEEDDDTSSISNYRQNISTHRPIAANDIEDLLGSGIVTHTTSPRCIACRDPGICHDKGLCMAVYRSQQ